MEAASLEPRLTVSRLGTYAIAAFVVLLVVAFVVVGVAFTLYGLTSGNVVPIVLGLALGVIAWFMRPRLGHPPSEGIVRRAEAPGLYDLADRVAAALDVSAIDVLVMDGEWNASWAVVGLRRKRVLTLGLPLFHALAPQQQVALIGHELAHARNGDATRGRFVGSSIDGLAELYGFLAPDGPEDVEGITLITKPILWVISRPAYWLLLLQLNLAQHDRHRAEYLADALAAQVAGTDAVVQLHERLLLGSVFETTVHRTSQRIRNTTDDDLFDQLRSNVNSVPARELERRRRVARLEESRLDHTHPPTGLRIALLEQRPERAAAVRQSDQAVEAIETELQPIRGRLARRLVEMYRSSLYEG